MANSDRREIYVIGLYDGTSIVGWYKADDEDVVKAVSEARIYTSKMSAVKDAELCNKQWDLDLSKGHKFIVAQV